MACPCRGGLLFCQKEGSSQIFVKNRLMNLPVAGPEFSKCPALGLRIKMEFKGFPGSRTQTVAPAGLVFSKIPALGLRIKTEINGFPGNHTQTVPATGPAFPFLPARGSRPETEFIGFAGRGARTLTANRAGSPTQKRLLRNSGTAFFSLLELLKWLITEREP